MVDTEGACPRLAMVGTVSKRGLIVRSLLPLLAPLTFLSRCESEPGVTDADTVPLRGAAAAFGAIVGSLPTDRQDELKTLPPSPCFRIAMSVTGTGTIPRPPKSSQFTPCSHSFKLAMGLSPF